MPSICAACNGACCKSLPFLTAKQILTDISQSDPESMVYMERALSHGESDKTVCVFLIIDEGCALEGAERPCICGEFKCDLFLLAKRDSQLASYCLENGQIIMDDPFTNKYLVQCDPSCEHKDKCPVPCRQDLSQ